MNKHKLFKIAFVLALVIGIVPALFTLNDWKVADNEARYEGVILLDFDALETAIKQVDIDTRAIGEPVDYFHAVARFNEIRQKIDASIAWVEVRGELGGRLHNRLRDIQMNLNSMYVFKYTEHRMAQTAHEYYKAHPPYERPGVEFPFGALAWNLLCGFFWTQWVWFLKFGFVAANKKRLLFELRTGRLILASAFWFFFYDEYLQYDDEPMALAFMAQHAAFNGAFALSAFVAISGGGVASGQTPAMPVKQDVNKEAKQKSGTQKKKSQKFFEFRESIATEGDPDSETTFVFGRTSGSGVITESFTIIKKKQFTQWGIAGKQILEKGKAKVAVIGAWVGQFNKDRPDVHRLAFGGRFSFAKKLTKNHTGQISMPVIWYERYFRDKQKNAFFTLGQVFDNIKDKYRVGTEFSVRKLDDGAKTRVVLSPFFGIQIKKKNRLTFFMSFDNQGPPRFSGRFTRNF